jgi:hypothetical protein
VVDTEQNTGKPTFPPSLPEQVAAIRNLLMAMEAPATVETIASAFKAANKARVSEVLQALVALGHAHKVDGDKYASASVMMAA